MCRPRAGSISRATRSRQPGYSVSSVFRKPRISPVLRAKAMLTALAWPVSFCTWSWKVSGYRSTNSCAISIAPSVEPPSWMMTSRFGYSCLTRLSSVSRMYRPWLKDGTAMLMRGSRPGSVTGHQPAAEHLGPPLDRRGNNVRGRGVEPILGPSRAAGRRKNALLSFRPRIGVDGAAQALLEGGLGDEPEAGGRARGVEHPARLAI